jgi:uncharacterized protein (DUF488 family)
MPAVVRDFTMTVQSPQLFTIGHSNHELAVFGALLQRHAVTAVADVRSTPYSRRCPHFNKQRLRAALQDEGIAYVFLGVELGARSKDPDCYEAGRVQYDRLAATSLFQQGLERLMTGAQSFRIALMCAEREPLECHRTVLVARALEQRGAQIWHIRADGSLESQHAALLRLVSLLNMNQGLDREHGDLFGDEQPLIEAALRRQAARIAYVDESMR